MNTYLMLATLAGAPTHMQELPLLEKTEVEPACKTSVQTTTMSATSTPPVTIEMDTERESFVCC